MPRFVLLPSPSQLRELIDLEILWHILGYNRSALASVQSGDLRLEKEAGEGAEVTAWLGYKNITLASRGQTEVYLLFN